MLSTFKGAHSSLHFQRHGAASQEANDFHFRLIQFQTPRPFMIALFGVDYGGGTHSLMTVRTKKAATVWSSRPQRPPPDSDVDTEKRCHSQIAISISARVKP